MARLLCKTAAVYRPRRPLESDFHRLIGDHFDDFRAAYAQRYARKHGHWRPVFDKTVRAFLACGDLAGGFARVRCPDCRYEFFVAFSCKQRCICPSCSQKRTILFGLRLAEDVCRAVPHRQFVWTVPKRLRVFFRYHRDLLGWLPRLAWRSLREVYRALLGDDATPGGVLAVQTFGQLLHYHPHVHGLVTDGAFTPNGRFLPLPANLGHGPFLRLWENAVFELLLDHNRIDPAVVAQIRSWRHSGFSVDRAVRLAPGDRDGIERLAQYMARSPFSLARMVRIGPGGQVVYRAEKDRPQRFPDPASAQLFPGVARNFQVYQPLDFLAELFQHIPDKGEHPIRYYGYYSSRARGARARRRSARPGVADQDEPSPAPTAPDRHRWAMLIKKIYHADPLRCPRCGASMKIIAFIEGRQGDVIRRILEHCGLWADPPTRAPPRSETERGAAWPHLRPDPDGDSHRTYEADPDFLEHLRREQFESAQAPREP